MIPSLINFKNNSNILISGVGGGFDFLCGFPIGIYLESMGHNIIYSNYSFTNLKKISENRIAEYFYKITANSKIIEDTYFPEVFASQWLKNKYSKDIPIYCYSNVGIKSLTSIFNYINKIHSLNYIITILMEE